MTIEIHRDDEHQQWQPTTSVCLVCNVPISPSTSGSVKKTCSSKCRLILWRNARAVSVSKEKDISVEAKRFKPHSTPCTRSQQASEAYMADDITVLPEPARMDNPMFDWELIARLADEYIVPRAWIERSVKACREAGVSPQYFIDRYLAKDDTPMDESVDTASRDIDRHHSR